ncbi:coiled-coil domain-containing protein 137 [Neocloeon triangulifer]|uniref:coiled-coil domain-containing protein 137 n=1 Tax=Neocloeon triangulifer TaxID=2078957 RepID=UPI00286F4604|nr:coiled-coil domain-containing protein 137 [Neocloeon triangulifer]
MVKRKIPTRKHRGVKDPEKQAAARFASIKDKVNNPPSSADDQFIPRRILELKSQIEKVKNRVPKKKTKTKSDGLIDTAVFASKEIKIPGMKRKEKPIHNFKQMPGEDGNAFLRRIQRKCQEVIHESKFEDKFDVEVQRNADTGRIESVDKLSIADAKFLKDLTPHNKTRKASAQSMEKKKARLQKLKEKKQLKKTVKVDDEFAKYKDKVEFGEVAHEPPKLTTLPRRAEETGKPGKRDLLLKGMFGSEEKVEMLSVFDRKLKTDGAKVGKKKKKNEKGFAEKIRLEAQRVAAVDAYRQMKARNQAKNKAS